MRVNFCYLPGSELLFSPQGVNRAFALFDHMLQEEICCYKLKRLINESSFIFWGSVSMLKS